MEQGALVVDASQPAAFAAAHVPGALNIWLDGLSSWGGWFLPYDRPILLVTPHDRLAETALRHLVRIGYENFAGYLEGGTESWYLSDLPTSRLPLLTMPELKQKMTAASPVFLLDARMPAEWAGGRLPGAVNLPLGHIRENLERVPREGAIAVYCGSGRRAAIAASIVRQSGRENVSLVLGGPYLWKKAGFPLEK